jgi:LysM repeat protein
MSRNSKLALFWLLILILLAPVATFAQENAPGTQTYTVQRGDNLFRIALRFGISTSSLAEANGITDPARIFAGQELTIPGFVTEGEAVENPLVAGNPITVTILPGETLRQIAERHGMTLEQIMQINQITNPDLIIRGQQLTVWETSASSAPVEVPEATVSVDAPIEAVAAPAEPAAQPETTTYVVQRGDQLSRIAQRFGVPWSTIAGMNGIANPNQIFAGQELTIPVIDSNTGQPSSNAAGQVPAPTITTGKQIVVDLSDQMTYAFDNGQLVRSVLSSTGLPATPTVLGDYRVYVKYNAQTMSGPGYYLPDVPYVMYFYQGYALHGTYWHNNFGNPMSHGCVNLPTPEAEWFYNFAEVGTPVHVQW